VTELHAASERAVQAANWEHQARVAGDAERLEGAILAREAALESREIIRRLIVSEFLEGFRLVLEESSQQFSLLLEQVPLVRDIVQAIVALENAKGVRR
jgi:hypothetical protein